LPVVGFAFEGIVDQLTDRFAFKELGPEFDRATFVEDLVLVLSTTVVLPGGVALKVPSGRNS
jgi:hypothetical protein